MKKTADQPNSEKRLRYAIYTRYSTDMQSDISLEAQEAYCRQAIAQRGGVVVAVFSDGAKNGWSLDREGFTDMQRAAEHGNFDAIMFWKFDRLARDHNQAVMIKMLLRREYNLKLHCVEGFSEDDDNSPYTAMMEQMLAVFSAFYSKNLSTETKRGKRHRAMNGEYNGSVPPLGFELVTLATATPERHPGLYIVPRAAALVRRAFELYTTGEFSDADIAAWLNERPYIQKLRRGQKPINKEMIRELLQNRTYTGRVPHTDTIYTKTLGQGKMSRRNRTEWFEGKHQGFISDELFEMCQQVRVNARRYRKTAAKMHTYILHDRVFCAHCVAKTPHGLVHENYGRMRPYYHNQDHKHYYRCIARVQGYETCGQSQVSGRTLDEQIVEILANMRIPADYKERVEQAVRNRIENAVALERMAEIEAIMERIDFRWDMGKIDRDEYLEKRRQLELEMESLRPIDYDNLLGAADLIGNFGVYWQQCETVNNPLEAKKQLIAKIVDRIFVYDEQIIAVVLHGDFALVLGENKIAPPDVRDAIQNALQRVGNVVVNNSQFGGDGSRTRDLCLDRAVC